MSKKNCIVQLGKIGDVLNVLPLAKKVSEEQGSPVAFVVGHEFSSALEGASYVQPIIFGGRFTQVSNAIKFARSLGYENILCTQTYGEGIRFTRMSPSFCVEAWRAAGRHKDYGLPLLIDKRDAEREAELLKKVQDNGKPNILLALNGQSSPFPYRIKLVEMLGKHFGHSANLVNMADFKARFFHDLIAVMERGAVLVAIDTGHLHLANAIPALPVVALATHAPTMWHGSPRRDNHVFYCRYNEFHERADEIVLAVSDAIGVPVSIPKPEVVDPSNLICTSSRKDRPVICHVWSGADNPDRETARRMGIARQSWAREAARHGNWREKKFAGTERTSLAIGDTSPLPYVRDMIHHGLDGLGPDDILLVSNADIGVCLGLSDEIEAQCKSHGAIFTHRWDFRRLNAPLSSKSEIGRGAWYPGSDLFAFTRGWWDKHGDKFPDMILGREAWDWVMRELIKEGGGAEVHLCNFHEKHASQWSRDRAANMGNKYNRGIARQFLEHRGIPLRELKHAAFISPEPVVQVSRPHMVAKPGEEMDIVIALGKGSKWENNELRYCLRSIERHAIGLRRIYVVGENPGFLSDLVTHVPIKEPDNSKEHNITFAIQEACKIKELSDDFIFFNDDHFLIAPFKLAGYPYYCRGSLFSHASGAKSRGYQRALMNTLRALKAAGKRTESYEVHVPIIYNKSRFLSLNSWWQVSAHTQGGMVARSVYVNALGLSGPRLPDCKIATCRTVSDVEARVKGRNVFSISDKSIANGVGDYLDKSFPSKSKYER